MSIKHFVNSIAFICMEGVHIKRNSEIKWHSQKAHAPQALFTTGKAMESAKLSPRC